MSILANLVNNALESFAPKQHNRYIKIHHSLAECCHLFTVSDNGSGISPGNLKYIFTPGFSTKFDYETGDVYRGVGLSHVKTIVTEHFKGDILVDSVPERGTTFEIKIPADSLEAQL